MILQCCYCNETFSDNIIIQILTHITNSLSNEFKQGLALLNEIIVRNLNVLAALKSDFEFVFY